MFPLFKPLVVRPLKNTLYVRLPLSLYRFYLSKIPYVHLYTYMIGYAGQDQGRDDDSRGVYSFVKVPPPIIAWKGYQSEYTKGK